MEREGKKAAAFARGYGIRRRKSLNSLKIFSKSLGHDGVTIVAFFFNLLLISSIAREIAPQIMKVPSVRENR